MEQPDAIIHQPVRLKIMAALKVLPGNEALEFVRLKSIVGRDRRKSRRAYHDLGRGPGMPRSRKTSSARSPARVCA